MSKINTTRQAQYQLVQKLASHFKIKKEILAAAMDDNPESGLIMFDVINEKSEREFNHQFYCTEVPKINLAQLMYADKFVKSPFYEAFLLAQGHGSKDVILSVHTAGTLWLIYLPYAVGVYEGPGAIVMNHEEFDCIVCEPIGNWLKHNYPRAESDGMD